MGLTSAATVFVVAAIGMTCGAGLYIEAAIATALVLLALQVVGAFEGRLGWKRYAMIYEVRANVGTTIGKETAGSVKADAVNREVNEALQRMQKAILAVLDSVHQRLSVLERDNMGGLERVSFTVTTTKSVHQRLLQQLRASDATDEVVAFFDTEED
jgi:putative Mg2+ transporter-C (MgtC) family protein